MVNETIINATGILQEISFENWVAVTTSIPFIIAMLVIWLFPVVLYLIIAASRKTRTASGKKLDSCMLSSSNALIPLGIWIFVQGSLILIFIIFPLWLKI